MEDSGKLGIGFFGAIERAGKNFKGAIREINEKEL